MVTTLKCDHGELVVVRYSNGEPLAVKCPDCLACWMTDGHSERQRELRATAPPSLSAQAAGRRLANRRHPSIRG